MPHFHLLYDSVIKTGEIIINQVNPNRVILGSLNKESKTNTIVLNTWKTILQNCPNTFIIIKIDLENDKEERMEFYLKKLNIEKNRLLLLSKIDNDSYLKLFTKIDILLDTFPYSGTTTSCNCLNNSTPIITLYNKNIHAHNVTSSILINMGLPELVSYSTEEYIQKTTDLVNAPDRINNYKKNINKQFTELMNPSIFIKDYEDLLMETYNKHISQTHFTKLIILYSKCYTFSIKLKTFLLLIITSIT